MRKSGLLWPVRILVGSLYLASLINADLHRNHSAEIKMPELDEVRRIAQDPVRISEALVRSARLGTYSPGSLGIPGCGTGQERRDAARYLFRDLATKFPISFTKLSGHPDENVRAAFLAEIETLSLPKRIPFLRSVMKHDTNHDLRTYARKELGIRDPAKGPLILVRGS